LHNKKFLTNVSHVNEEGQRKPINTLGQTEVLLKENPEDGTLN
jgi:hypothetical protein